MKKRGRKPLKKEEIAEDWCFVCKEGGNLLICDYRNCLKAYHVHCVEKDESFLTSEERWNCKWHYCFACEEASSFHCHCCPKSVCRSCILDSEDFVVVKGNYGFCCNCLKLALLIEENRDVDSDGEIVDFKDLKTHEGLFMDYYSKMIKDIKSLTLEDLYAAKDRLKKTKFDFDELVDEDEDADDDDEIVSDYEVEHRTEDLKLKCRKESKDQLGVKKPKNVKSKKLQFTGWGSTPLIQFLESIGQDTSKELHQRKVENLINAYIQENKLFDSEKKRKIMCDEKLQAIFGRKVVNRSKIYSLLECHFVDNLEKSEEEEEEEEEEAVEEEIKFDEHKDEFKAFKTRRKLEVGKDSQTINPVCHASQSCFAAIIAENIKLVYLRRSLLQELSKEPESFQNKVKGTFIRVKTDPNDYRQRNSHELLQVTGVKKSLSGESNAEIILLVSNLPLEIRIGSLSDADFEEAECADLRQKVKDGLIQKPTVVELQEKARSLHEDITKNWIARELKLLDIRIPQANEKGWKRELYDYLEKKKLLQTPSEQSRLLTTYPTVIAEELEPLIEENVHNGESNELSPQSIFPTDGNCKWGNNGTSSTVERTNYSGKGMGKEGNESSPQSVKTNPTVIAEELEPMIEENVHNRESNESSQQSVFRTDLNCKWGNNGTPSMVEHTNYSEKGMGKQWNESSPQSVFAADLNSKWGNNGNSRSRDYPAHASSQDGKQNFAGTSVSTLTETDNKTMTATHEGSPDQVPAPETQREEKSPGKDKVCSPPTTNSNQNQGMDSENATYKKQESFVDKVFIDLSSDDETVYLVDSRRKQNQNQNRENPNCRVWHIAGPNGERPGIYSLALLKCWSDTSPYALRYKAWKETETEEQAIRLGDAIRLAFDEE